MPRPSAPDPAPAAGPASHENSCCSDGLCLLARTQWDACHFPRIPTSQASVSCCGPWLKCVKRIPVFIHGIAKAAIPVGGRAPAWR